MKHFCALLCLPLLAPLAATANDEAAASAPVSTASAAVTVRAPREPAIMPYKDAHEFFAKLAAVPHDKIRMRFIVSSQDAAVKPADLRIRLVGETVDIPVPVGPEGDVEIPLSQQALDEKAEFVTNQKKGTMNLEIRIVPRLGAPETLSYADALDAAAQTERVVKTLMPWYLRMLVSAPDRLSACFEREGGRAELVSRAGRELLPLHGTRQCAWVDLDEDRRGDWQAVVLTPPYTLEFGERSLWDRLTGR